MCIVRFLGGDFGAVARSDGRLAMALAGRVSYFGCF